MIPSASKEVSIKFEYQCIHILNIGPRFCKPSIPYNYSTLRGFVLTLLPININWRIWDQKYKGGVGRNIWEA